LVLPLVLVLVLLPLVGLLEVLLVVTRRPVWCIPALSASFRHM